MIKFILEYWLYIYLTGVLFMIIYLILEKYRHTKKHGDYETDWSEFIGFLGAVFLSWITLFLIVYIEINTKIGEYLEKKIKSKPPQFF